jgi:hypothetical protein
VVELNPPLYYQEIRKLTADQLFAYAKKQSYPLVWSTAMKKAWIAWHDATIEYVQMDKEMRMVGLTPNHDAMDIESEMKAIHVEIQAMWPTMLFGLSETFKAFKSELDEIVGQTGPVKPLEMEKTSTSPLSASFPCVWESFSYF